MLTINASPLVFLLILCAGAGVCGWIGYLLGRVRSLEETVRPAAPAGASVGTPVVYGVTLLALALLAVAAMFAPGVEINGTGGLLAVLLVGLVVVGAYLLAVAARRAVERTTETHERRNP